MRFGGGSVLRNLGITTVVVTGVSLNIGVPNTVMDLVNQAFEVVVPKDAVAGTPDDYGEMMIAHTLRFLATITSTDDLVAAWSAPGSGGGSPAAEGRQVGVRGVASSRRTYRPIRQSGGLRWIRHSLRRCVYP